MTAEVKEVFKRLQKSPGVSGVRIVMMIMIIMIIIMMMMMMMPGDADHQRGHPAPDHG